MMGKKDGTKKHSAWDNHLYMFRALKKGEGTGAFAVCAGSTILNILLPFLETALAGAVAACLVSGRKPGEILLLAAGYVILLQAVRCWHGNLNMLRGKAFFMFRMDTASEYDRKTLEMDGQCLESAAGRKKWETAKRNMYWGDSQGIGAYAKSFWDMLSNLGGLIVYGVIVGRESPGLLVFLLLQMLFLSWLHTLAKKRADGMEGEIEEKWAGFQYLRRESIVPGSGKDIRLYRMDKWFLHVFDEILGRICVLIDRQQNSYMAAGIANHLISFARNGIVYGWLIREMALGSLSLPAFLLYVGIVAGFEAWVRGLIEAFTENLQNEKILEEYRDFMEFGVVEEGKPAPEHGGKLHEIRLENVSFRYDGNEEDTIHNLNLTIRPGEKLALVGLNGAGKTTLIKLLCGLYRPTSGRILLDGQDMQELSQREVFKEFTVVFQDVFAFSFPLLENVSCVRSGEEDRRKLEESLRAAGLWEKVQSLPAPSGAGAVFGAGLRRAVSDGGNG